MEITGRQPTTNFGRVLSQLVMTMSVVMLGTTALASGFPERPIKIIVTNAPGGSTDLVARIVADDLTKRLGQPVIVENRPGAGGNIATRTVALAKPDGYTILLTSNNHTINPLLYRDAGYVLDDLVPVAKLTDSPLVVAVPQNSPYKTFQDLVDNARRHPGKIAYGSSGVGLSPHIAGQLLMEKSGVQLLHVPFKGSGASLVALQGEQIQMAISSLTALKPYLQSGKLRALAVTSAQSWPSNIDIPPVAATLPGYEYLTWFGLFVPHGTPAEIVLRLNGAVRSSLSRPETRDKLEEQGIGVARTSLDEFVMGLKAEHDEAKKLISTIGLSLQ